MEPINALAESEDVEGLLFCGTDGGLYISIDGGFSWSNAHPELPRVPVHDLAIQERENELVIGTHGRSIYVLDINPLIEGLLQSEGVQPKELSLSLEAPEALIWSENWGERGYGWGEPREPEVTIDVFLPNNGDYTLQLTDSLGSTVCRSEMAGQRRGWQSLSFVPRTLDEDGYLGVGTYTLGLRFSEGKGEKVETEWSIVEEED